jgi:DNA-binding NtrC family response regulator
MRPLLRMAEVMAGRDSPVLLEGESGTGKEIMAEFLHLHSKRARAPFVAVNCSAISPTLVESELFGHKRGAFTHAHSDRPGCIRSAQGGTLFLDEIGDMPLGLQAHFLRVLQEKKVRPVGGDEEKSVDFRLVCATHKNLAEEVARGRFRHDLYYRLKVLELRLPSLREREMDIPVLMRAFLTEFAGAAVAEAEMGRLPSTVLRHPFPGNVRELRNCAERFATLRELGYGWEQVLEVPLAPEAGGSMRAQTPLRPRRVGEEEIQAALQQTRFHRGQAAELLGISRRTLHYHLQRMRTTGA